LLTILTLALLASAQLRLLHTLLVLCGSQTPCSVFPTGKKSKDVSRAAIFSDTSTVRITQEECAKGMVRSLVGTFFSNVVRAWCIAHMTKDYLKLSPGTLSTVGGKFIARSTPNHKAGLHSAFVGFLGFILPARLSNVFWAGQPWNIFAITTAHEFVSTMLMGSIIGYLTKN
jgi:hypothetical protein